MKIVLDLDQLVQEGRITPEEYARLESLASRETASLALNILVAFGVVAVAGGALALLKSSEAAILLGSGLGAIGVYLKRSEAQQWQPLAVILLLIGSLTAGGGVASLTDESPAGFTLISIVFAGTALLAGSGLLAALSALSLLAASGGMTGSAHAVYFLGIEQPLLTVVLFGILSFATYRVSLVVPADYGRLAIVFSRTCLFIVNLGFWIGSLWGDPLLRIPDWLFAIVWALALIAVGNWAARQNRRWVVNLVAVFAAIHFYTQYFARLGASPGSVLVAGLIALGIAVRLIQYNRARISGAPEPA